MSTTWKPLSDKLKSNEAKSYFEYVSESGKDSLYGYYDKAREAKTALRLNDADYGASAASLLSAGLSNSGYRDYLKSRADRSYRESLGIAEEAKKTDEYKNRSGYEKYLSDYDSVQKKISDSLIESIGKGNDFDFNRAYSKAVEAGLSDTMARITANRAILLAKNNTYLGAVAFAKANNLSAKKAKAYAKFLGLSEIYAERVYQEISTFTKEEKEFYSSMSAEDYYKYIMSKSKK